MEKDNSNKDKLKSSNQNYDTFGKGFSAAIIGATGGVGEQLTRLLVNDPQCKKVTVLVRKPLEEWKDEEYKSKLIIIESD